MLGDVERLINYDISGGDKEKIFEPVNVEDCTMFTLQFFVSTLAVAFDNFITLSVSNDGINFFEAPVGVTFTFRVIMNTAGDSTYCIFVGTGIGVGSCRWISANFKQPTPATGTIDKVIIMGKN